jgi:hypothetical protein
MRVGIALSILQRVVNHLHVVEERREEGSAQLNVGKVVTERVLQFLLDREERVEVGQDFLVVDCVTTRFESCSGEYGDSSPRRPAPFFEDLCVNNRARRSALGGLQLQACALSVIWTVLTRYTHDPPIAPCCQGHVFSLSMFRSVAAAMKPRACSRNKNVKPVCTTSTPQTESKTGKTPLSRGG